MAMTANPNSHKIGIVGSIYGGGAGVKRGQERTHSGAESGIAAAAFK